MSTLNPRSGCYNHEPYRDTMLVADGQIDCMDLGGLSGVRATRMKTIVATGSKGCHYDNRATDARCAGCVWLNS